jgi:hypothetical protein
VQVLNKLGADKPTPVNQLEPASQVGAGGVFSPVLWSSTGTPSKPLQPDVITVLDDAEDPPAVTDAVNKLVLSWSSSPTPLPLVSHALQLAAKGSMQGNFYPPQPVWPADGSIPESIFPLCGGPRDAPTYRKQLTTAIIKLATYAFEETGSAKGTWKPVEPNMSSLRSLLLAVQEVGNNGLKCVNPGKAVYASLERFADHVRIRAQAVQTSAMDWPEKSKALLDGAVSSTWKQALAGGTACMPLVCIDGVVRKMALELADLAVRVDKLDAAENARVARHNNHHHGGGGGPNAPGGGPGSGGGGRRRHRGKGKNNSGGQDSSKQSTGAAGMKTPKQTTATD